MAYRFFVPAFPPNPIAFAIADRAAV